MKIFINFIDNYFYRILFFIISFVSSFSIFYNFTKPNNFDKKEVLSTLISTISIIIAIIVTYLFSKLFAEKSIKIERKKDIDLLSKKITYLRQIASYIKSLHNFWKFNDVNIKSAVEKNYPSLTYEEYRGYESPNIRQYTYEEKIIIDEKIYGSSGQAYLAIKGLIDNESPFLFISEFNPTNYSVDDIFRYQEYANSFWYLLDRSDD